MSRQENSGDIQMCKLSQIAQFLNGYAFKSKNYVDNGIRVIRIANVQDGYIVDDAPCFYPLDADEDVEKYSLFAGDLLISLTGNVGRVGILPAAMLPAALNQRVCCLRIDETIVDRKYLFYYLRQHQFMRDCVKASKGVAQLNLSTKWLADYEIPLPALDDQKRIVARIEELFSELDNGVESLRKSKQQLAVYRQAVLKGAFEGVFTKEWRDKHPNATAQQIWLDISEKKNQSKNAKTYRLEERMQLSDLPDSWMWVNIGDISHGPEYGTSQKSVDSGKVPVIRMGNLQNGVIDWTELVYSNDDAEITRYALKAGDVLFNRTNSPELVGKTAIYRGEREAIFAGYLIRVNQFDCINAEYLAYYMNSFTAKQYGNKVKTDGVNQSNINGKKLCSYPFPLCSTEEQAQIVYELESRLSVCDSIEKTVDTALQQAEAMRQSILKKAFEGRL